jgi:RNA polymerase sigma-70 factor (ECF subfamily)
MDAIVGLSATAEDRKQRLAEAFSDSSAFRAWYDDAVGRVYGYLYGRCGGDIEVAEDITQQAFIQAIRHWQTFDGRSDPITWLCSIARNKLADYYREQERQRRRHLQLVVREIESQTSAANHEIDDRDAIVAALRQLPDMERTALVLRYVDDLSVSEVAALLRRSVDATDALIRRAKERFRTVYPEAFDE